MKNLRLLWIAGLAVIVNGAFLAAAPASEDPDFSFHVMAKTFGIDSLQYHNPDYRDPLTNPEGEGDLFDLFDRETLRWRSWGVMKIAWQDVQPEAGGDYIWDHLEPNPEGYQSLDPIMQEIFKREGFAQIAFYPTSTWGTTVQAPINQTGWWRIYQSKPIDLDLNDWSNCPWGLVVNAIVERYDGDGTNDAEFFTDPTIPVAPYRVLRRIDIGAEIESHDHWVEGYEQGEWIHGDPDDYFETLKVAYDAAHYADNPPAEISVGRAPMLTYDVTNDLPCDDGNFDEVVTRIYHDPANGGWKEFGTQRGANWLVKTLQKANDPSTDYFDVMNIHSVGKYTCTLGFLRFLRQGVEGVQEGLGEDFPIYADDYIMNPHNGFNQEEDTYRWFLCPWVFPDDKVVTSPPPPYSLQDKVDKPNPHTGYEGEAPHCEDAFLGIILGFLNDDFEDETYQDYRASFFDRQAGHLVKRMIFGLRSGFSRMTIQPAIDEYNWKGRLYRIGGLIDKLAYDYCWGLPEAERPMAPALFARKPAYHQFVWLYDYLYQKQQGWVILEESTPPYQDTYFPLDCVYRLENKPDENDISTTNPVWFAWHDTLCDDTGYYPTYRQTRSYSLDVGPDITKVSVFKTFKMENLVSGQAPLVAIKRVVDNKVDLTLGNEPIIVVPHTWN